MSQLIQSGGVQTVTQLNQIVYLDFDGEYTSYNGEILNVDGVVVEDSKLSGERIAEIVAALNEKYVFAGVKFVTERPIDGEYSTVYVGKTDDFDQYGNFAGLAETIDKGNTNKSDNAFVMLDSTASNAQICWRNRRLYEGESGILLVQAEQVICTNVVKPAQSH